MSGERLSCPPFFYEVSTVTIDELQSGHVLLLCTDGLMKHVSDAQIAELLSTTTSANEAASALVGAALQAGGSDNVTVVAARFL